VIDSRGIEPIKLLRKHSAPRKAKNVGTSYAN